MLPRSLALILLSLVAAPAVAEDAKTVFEKRLAPIFKSPNPSSCVQCHLAGVDLKNYIRPTHEATFVNLRDLGLIDLDAPEKSKILQLIRMGEEDKKGAALIHQKNREAELAAFTAWIKESAADPALRKLPKANEASGATRPVEVVRHARTDRLAQSFENTIWALRFRCMSCHIEGSDENKKLVAKHGERVAWFKRTPEATLAHLMSTKLMNVKTPRESLLLVKPLMEVDHGGGKKMLVGDQGYQLFLSFLEDYAAIKKDAYEAAASLPKKDRVARFGGEMWFKLTNLPDAWGDKLLQVDIHAWDAARRDWEPAPIATSDRLSSAKARLWQHTLTLLAEPESARAKAWRAGKASLPQGKYLVKVLVADAGRAPQLVGQGEVTSVWADGYGRMTSLDAKTLK